MDVVLKSRIAFIISVFGPGIVNKRSISVNCSKCGKDRPSKKKLVIRLDDGMHHCWVCGLKGRSLKYTIRKYYPRHYESYARLFESEDYQSKILVEEEIKEVKIPNGFVLLGNNLRSKDPDVRDTLDYAYSRGLTHRDIWYFRVGTCQNGSFRRRLIIPSFDEDGKLNYYSGRSIDSDKKIKYLNAKAPKKTLIFNEINIRWDEELTIVEGPMDLVKCNENAVPILGSTLHEKYELFQKIVKNSTPVLMALDPDARDKMHKICIDLYSFGAAVRILNLEGYSDVGAMSKVEFSKRRENARVWQPDERLIHLIRKIRSGSLF